MRHTQRSESSEYTEEASLAGGLSIKQLVGSFVPGSLSTLRKYLSQIIKCELLRPGLLHPEKNMHGI